MRPPVMGMAVQQQVRQIGPPEPPVEIIGVLQVLVAGDRSEHRIVVHRRQAQPTPVPVFGQPIGEPAQLALSDPTVVISVAVALGHGGVQPGHHHREIGHLEQRPRLVRGEAHPLDSLVELLERGGEVLPFRPVRCHRLALICFLTLEVGLAGFEVDVVVAGHDSHPPVGQVHRLGQRGEEPPYLVELAAQAPGGQVTGDHHQVRTQSVVPGQQVQVIVQPPEQDVTGPVGRDLAIPAEELIAAELGIRHVQHHQLVHRASDKLQVTFGTATESPRPGQPKPVGGDRVAVPPSGARDWREGQQTHYLAGDAVKHRAAAEPPLDPQRAAGCGIQLQETVPDGAADGCLHPGAVRTWWVPGVAEHVHHLARRGCVGGKPSRDGIRGQRGAGQHEAGDVVSGLVTRRGPPHFHRCPQSRAVPGRELHDDLARWLILRPAVSAERGVDHMRAGQDLPRASEYAHPDGAPVHIQHAHGTAVHGVRHP